MRKIILDLALSLDGFIEGPNGEIDWCIMDEDMGFESFLAGIDTIFYGRISYDLWGQFQPAATVSPSEKDIWKAIHEKEKYVFSRSLQADTRATYINADFSDRINKIKAKPGKNIWLYGGAKLITTFIDLELIDSYKLAVYPVILGAGKPLFSNLQQRINLTLKEVKPHNSGVIILIYEPLRNK